MKSSIVQQREKVPALGDHLLNMTFWNPSMVNSSQPQKPSLAGALATECAVAAVEPAEKKMRVALMSITEGPGWGR